MDVGRSDTVDMIPVSSAIPTYLILVTSGVSS